MKILFLTLILIFSSTITNSDENKTYEILKNLRCLVCQGQTISDSNSDFALTIKDVVNEKVNEGLSKKEIYNFLSDKYGDWILFNTPLKQNSYFLWFMPYVLFILGGVFLYFIIKKRVEKTK
tara:strand:- start:1359 stop:1724 length:366 start_codon:yes stop_codon:yes gene_type:complete